MTRNRITGPFAGGLAALLLAVTGPAAASSPPAGAAAARPNIVLVLSDDQEVASVDQMPNVKALAARGSTFTHAYLNDPTCSPSRATVLTGLYDHNTGVTTNLHRTFYGGGLPARTVAVALQNAGYRTALIGKYFNGYPYPAPLAYVPQGWDRWFARIGGTAVEYDYRQNDDGKVVSFGSTPADYATDVYRRRAVAFVPQAAADGVPFFLELPTHAPHRPATPPPRHADLFPT